MYDVNDYGRMMADPIRMNAYTEALRRTVKPGNVVVDVGTGTGIFAMLAARFGARKVYAIDTNPCIHLAREVAKRNGFGDTIEFIHKSVFDVELPEKADVLVSDCRGGFPIFAENLEVVPFARRQFLAAGGATIAQKDLLFGGLIEQPELLQQIEAPWSVGGFDWEPCRREAYATRLPAPSAAIDLPALLTDPFHWGTVDYETVSSPNVHGAVTSIARRAGFAHFLALWFRSVLIPGVEFGSGLSVYRPVILPLDSNLQVAVGEQLEIRVDALRSKSGYCFAWQVRTPQQDCRRANDFVFGRLLENP